MAKAFVNRRALVIGTALGAAYGLIARFTFQHARFGGTFAVMTLAFLFVVPIVMGYLTVRPAQNPSWAFRIFAPWLPSLVAVAAAAVLGWEGAICIIMALPVMLSLASLGGIIAGLSAARKPAFLPVMFVLPYVLAPFERQLTHAPRATITRTAIEIDAPPSVVWPLVASVDSIRPDEQRPALFTAMGFPRPISAVIDRQGRGGIRQARFAGGLVFTETVTDWEPGSRLSFTIRPNTAEVPAATLDPHVVIGGPYFDVLTGTYELLPLEGGRTRLLLSSEHRVSTRFNRYSGWWADRVMRSIQANILAVIRARAERATAAQPGSPPAKPV